MKLIKVVIFALFMSVLSSNAQASLKTDISAFAGRVSSTINNTVENIKVKINTAAQKVQEWYTGSKIKSTIETVKALKEDVLTAASTVQDEYQETMDNFDEIGDSATDAYEREMEDFQNSQTGQAVELSQQLDDVNKQIDARKEVLLAEVNAKNEAAQENLAILQSMYETTTDEDGKAQLASQIESVQNEISQYGEYSKQIEEGKGEYLEQDSEYSKLQAKKEELAMQLAELSADVGSDALDKFGDAFTNQSDAERSEEYNKVISENFLLREEAETAESVARITQHRQEVLIKDIAHAFYAAATLKLQLDADLERVERKKDNMASVDYKITAVNLLIDQRIEDINILYNYTNLMIADLRLKTSQNMFRQDYRLKTYGKDPAVLNLDNYIFTKEDVPTDEGQTSFLDSVTGE